MKILVKSRYLPSSEIVEAPILFQDHPDMIYYCWQYKDSKGNIIGAKCLPIYKGTIEGDTFEFLVSHAKYSIEHFRIDRERVFEVIEIRKII